MHQPMHSLSSSFIIVSADEQGLRCLETSGSGRVICDPCTLLHHDPVSCYPTLSIDIPLSLGTEKINDKTGRMMSTYRLELHPVNYMVQVPDGRGSKYFSLAGSWFLVLCSSLLLSYPLLFLLLFPLLLLSSSLSTRLNPSQPLTKVSPILSLKCFHHPLNFFNQPGFLVILFYVST